MTIDKMISILENTKRIEKTELVEIKKIVEMLNEIKQNQDNLKNHLLRLRTLTKTLYTETNDLTDYAKILAYDNALEFYRNDIEKEW